MFRLSCFMFLVLCVGCESGFIKPETSMSAGPGGSLFKYNSSKDVLVEADGVDVDPDTKHVKMARFRLSSMSSPVITANVDQMRQLGDNYLKLGEAWAIYTRSVGEMGREIIGALKELRQFAPSIRGSSPIGSVDIPPQVLESYFQWLSKQRGDQPAVIPTTTSPAQP